LNKKIFAIILVTILAISIAVGVVLYSANQKEPRQGPDTIIGTLAYAPGHAIQPGISATSITPSVSPAPTTRTFIDVGGQNDSVASFVFLNFNAFTSGSSLPGDFPAGFNGYNGLVEVTGQMSYNPNYSAYVMNVSLSEMLLLPLQHLQTRRTNPISRLWKDSFQFPR
jgi:hypothetical protein